MNAPPGLVQEVWALMVEVWNIKFLIELYGVLKKLIGLHSEGFLGFLHLGIRVSKVEFRDFRFH